MASFSTLVRLTGGTLLQAGEDVSITSLILDSRKAIASIGAVFFAVKGDRHDGHQYVVQLYSGGVRNFVVESTDHLPTLSELRHANVLQVRSSILALQQLAANHREQFSIPIVGITGSNGKTIIKEWLFQILSKHEVVVKNPGSYNSQVGVPLSVWQLRPHHTIGLFEAGISKPGEMDALANVIKPTVGIFTNIGSAHDEGFSTRAEKISEKLKLFSSCKPVIYCKEHTDIHEQFRNTSIPTISWGYHDADVIIVNEKDQRYQFHYQHAVHSFIVPFADHASRENVFHCITFLLVMGFTQTQIQEGINSLKTVPMRLELKEGINQCQVIDDTYNNDIGGLEISLQFLAHQHQKKKKRVILSDILQSGLSDEALVQSVAALINKSSVHHFVGIGPALFSHQHLFSIPSSFYASTEDFINSFHADAYHQEVILVKGARAFQFEKIARLLQRKVHGTVVEIDLGALVHNYNYFKSLLKPTTKVMVMVKAFAYGSGSNEIASLLQFHQADYLGVAYADEGVELRKNNIRLPIMVMNPSEDSFEQLLQYNLQPELYNFSILSSFLSFLKGRTSKVHIKLDTGMHRLGFEEHELDELIRVLQANSNLNVASVFSHLAGADEGKHDAYSQKQAQMFANGAERIAMALGYKPLFHILNSPGILRLPQYQFDMVRLGIGLYGVDPTEEGKANLRPVATLKTVISQVKTIAQGKTVGYGRRGLAERDVKIATIAIGYADGFSRAFSRGTGKVYINGKKARVIGNVCMDMTMIDVTDIDAREGDEVIIFGKELPITEVAGYINTIPYEILTNTSERVKRVFVAEGI